MDAPHNRTQCQIHDCKPNTIDGALPDGHRTDSKEYVETALRVRAFMGRAISTQYAIRVPDAGEMETEPPNCLLSARPETLCGSYGEPSNPPTVLGQDSTKDSGHSATDPSPPLKGGKHKVFYTSSDTKGRVFQKEIPKIVSDDFVDLKILYSEPLWKAVSTAKSDPADISMSLKVFKTVKKFFNQKHVLEDLKKRDLQLQIVEKGLVPLAFIGGGPSTTSTCGDETACWKMLCGLKAQFTNAEASLSSTATIGGLILVTHSERTLPTLYAITAHHPLRKLYQEFVSAGALAHVPDKHDFTRTIGRVPDTFRRSVHRPRNRDWVLVEIDRREWKSNLLVELPSTGSSVIGSKAYRAVEKDGPWAVRNTELRLAPRRLPKHLVVIALTSSGFKHGVLAAKGSSILTASGSAFVDAMDFVPGNTRSNLLPGDSGSWVVGASDGFVYGHVLSADSFGEAYVMPMCDTLSEVRSFTGAKCVSLPSGSDVVFMRDLGLQSQVQVQSVDSISGYSSSYLQTLPTPPPFLFRY
ncbi:hypothetical protein B0T24DRAFT_711131 [Lasiosphaeria ovina]|uniref:Uncharacterized protein n=1 Tax=Lasiosphaeria ovina TaxID=92902 RepID=A0AAE0N0L5_9PEZI|nr:hypothetical protein B0T24DRAFT_711131 [Lasiosphaeria ovina]